MGTGVLFPREKRLGREADHSTPSIEEIKNREDLYPFSYTSSECGA
jgi:hypothetical protein